MNLSLVRSWTAIAAVLLAIPTLAAPAAAQGTIEGTVAFDGLATFPTATITIEDIGVIVASGTSSRTDGSFSITDIPNGTYDVVVDAPCFNNEMIGAITVADNTQDLGTVTLFAGTTSVSRIQIAGDFTSWDLGTAPDMTQTSSCVWADTVTISTGTYFFKFITDNAFDTPADYGGDEGLTLNQPGGPHDTYLVAGPGTAIKTEVLVAGDYVFTLDEAAQTFTTTLLGGEPTGSVSGTVEFSGLSETPYPAATVKLMDGATTVRTTTSDPDTRTFSMTLVPDGTYSVEVSSPCFTTQVVSSVVVAGGNTDVGVVGLTAGTSAFTNIQLAGEFTGNFDLGQAPQMTQGPDCVWTTTVFIAAGTYNFKLVTNGAFDSPNDYGWMESETYIAPGTFAVRPVSGLGTAIRMQVDADDVYEFILDERTQSLRVGTVVAVEAATWGQIKSVGW